MEIHQQMEKVFLVFDIKNLALIRIMRRNRKNRRNKKKNNIVSQMSNRGTRNGRTGLEQFGLQPLRRVQPLSIRCQDTIFTLPPITNVGDIGFFLYPTQGLGVNERLADSIHLVDLMFNYFILLGTALQDQVRVIVFQTTGLQPTGVPPAVSDILEFTNPNSVFQTNSVQSFKILYDRTHTMCMNSPTALIAEKMVITPAIKRIDFVAGTVQAYSGQIWYLVIGLNPALTNTMSFVSRLNYFSV